MVELIVFLEPLFALFMAHLIGDYLLQNDWMALNKKSSTFHCSVHIITYMIPFVFMPISLLGFILIAIQHFVVDRTNIIYNFMVWKGQDKFVEPPCFPWSIIVMDNISHIVWIWVVYLLF